MSKHIRHTVGFSCAPGSGFFARCPECKRLLIFGQTCVCGTRTNEVKVEATFTPHWGAMWLRESLPRDVCVSCSFEYTRGTDHQCAA